ncbi:MAG: lamin tail domain-containing protein, partial [Melioribacteraceae bacterium]
IQSLLIDKIESGDSFLYTFEFHNYGFGKNNLIAEIIFENDEYIENNIAFAGFASVIINEIRNDIIINEFMPAPSSGLPEWIELFNRSEKIIDLKNYKVADESSEIRVTIKSLFLNPGEYFLIIGDSSFFNKYNTKSKFVIAGFPSLNNTSDKIILSDSLNRVIDSLQYFSTWNGETGKSFERIDSEINSELAVNWSLTKNKNGGTPGEINSVTQKSFDAGISQIYFNPQKPFYGDDVIISAALKNYGKENASLKLILKEENNLLEETEINIAPNDSLNYTFHFIIEKLESTRNFTINIEFDKDQDSTNNYFTANISPGYNYNALIINEIMFTPQNGEPEWIEFYNKENYKINLSGWSVSDILTNPVKTKIIDSLFFIEPKSYLVLTKDSSIINYHDSITSKILVSSFANLNNSQDGVVIKDSYENIIDSVHYTASWKTKTGYSLERISFEENSNDPENWNYSFDIEQGTPGRPNSVSQKANDLAVAEISFSPAVPEYGNNVFINTTVKNEGFVEANNFSIKFYDSQSNNIFDEINIASLEKNNSIKITSGNFKIFDVANIFSEIKFSLDDNLSNNRDSIIVVPGFNKNEILINEVMFNPDADKPEWIEFYNNTNHEINLYGWRVSDILPSPKESIITNEYYKIFPSQYFIITNDTTAFHKNYNVDIPVFQCAFGTLGNSEDGILVYDFYKNVIDSLFYTSRFGNVKGSSIERLSFTGETNEISNWIVSINSAGSSPGFPNSV